MSRSQEPEKPDLGPLSGVAADQIIQFDLTVNGATTTLKSVDGDWRVVAPFSDRASIEAVERLVNAVREIRLGSVLSENPAKHSQYDLDGARATRLQVFVKGK